jgi:hypothetical protein
MGVGPKCHDIHMLYRLIQAFNIFTGGPQTQQFDYIGLLLFQNKKSRPKNKYCSAYVCVCMCVCVCTCAQTAELSYVTP